MEYIGEMLILVAIFGLILSGVGCYIVWVTMTNEYDKAHPSHCGDLVVTHNLSTKNATYIYRCIAWVR